MTLIQKFQIFKTATNQSNKKNTAMKYAIVKTETGEVNIIKYSAYDPDLHDLDSVFDTLEEAKYFLNMLSELNLRNS